MSGFQYPFPSSDHERQRLMRQADILFGGNRTPPFARLELDLACGCSTSDLVQKTLRYWRASWLVNYAKLSARTGTTDRLRLQIEEAMPTIGRWFGTTGINQHGSHS